MLRGGRGRRAAGGREEGKRKCKPAWDWRGSAPKAFICGHPNGRSVLGAESRGTGGRVRKWSSIEPPTPKTVSGLGCWFKRVLEGQLNCLNQTRS